MIRNSLRLRLWLTIGLALAPVLMFALADYRQQRTLTIERAHEEIRQYLSAARREADKAHQNVGLALRLMARSNDLRSNDSTACEDIARRVLASMEDVMNIGAARSDGEIFCSALPGRKTANIADRAWFQATLDGNGISHGESYIGRISNKPVLTFGYPLSSPEGKTNGLVFATLSLDWLNSLIEDFKLPPGWEASLVDQRGHVLAHYPNPEQWQNHVLAPDELAQLRHTLTAAGGIAELAGPDARGAQRGRRAAREPRHGRAAGARSAAARRGPATSRARGRRLPRRERRGQDHHEQAAPGLDPALG